MTRRTGLFSSVLLVLLASATVASAQGLPPPPPPPTAMPPVAAPTSDAVPPAPPMPPMMQQPQAPTAPPMSPPPMTAPPGYPPAMMYGPSRLPYAEGDPIPPGYEIQMRPRMRMALAGMATFAPLYGLSVLFGASYLGNERGGASMYGPLLVPVIGPFVTIGTADTDFGTFFLLLDGLGQATGAALFIAGMVSEEKYLARRTAGFDIRPEVFVGPRSAALRWTF